MQYHPIDKEIGKRIKFFRQNAELTQVQLGLRLNPPISAQNISFYEAGRNRVSCSTLLELCKALKCSPMSFLKGIIDTIEGDDSDKVNGIVKYEIRQIINKMEELVS